MLLTKIILEVSEWHSVLSEYAAVEDVAIFAENYKSIAASQANT